MRFIKLLFQILVSIFLQIILLVPKLCISILKIAESILRIVRLTVQHLCELIQKEMLKNFIYGKVDEKQKTSREEGK